MHPDERARCPACAALVRAGAPWCTQCYADLRVADVEPPAEEQPVPAAPPAPAPPAPPEWPCAACGTANDLDVASCAACGAGFLAVLAGGGRPALVLPVVGDLAALDRAARAGLALAVALVAVLLTWLLTWLLSELLGGLLA